MYILRWCFQHHSDTIYIVALFSEVYTSCSLTFSGASSPRRRFTNCIVFSLIVSTRVYTCEPTRHVIIKVLYINYSNSHAYCIF